MSERKELTFSQRYGYEAIPGRLRLGELPPQARTRIWNVLYEFEDEATMEEYTIDHMGVGLTYAVPLLKIMRDLHGQRDGKPLDEWTDDYSAVEADLKRRIGSDPFHHVFDLIEFIMQHQSCPHDFVERMARVFGFCNLAYMIDPGPPAKIFPAATPEERIELTRNLDELHAAGLRGSTAHLRNASKCINNSKWADSVRESIHAVESVARQIDPAASNTLGKALGSLKRKRVLKHSALIDALDKLYGYTLGEQGIRHALLEKAEADVTVDEAVFFLGACASFASYLWRKHQAAASQ